MELKNWYYRIFKRTHKHKYLHEPGILFEVREVFIDENGDISAIAETPDVIAHSLDDLKLTLNKMLESCDLPIMEYNTGEEI